MASTVSAAQSVVGALRTGSSVARACVVGPQASFRAGVAQLLPQRPMQARQARKLSVTTKAVNGSGLNIDLRGEARREGQRLPHSGRLRLCGA